MLRSVRGTLLIAAVSLTCACQSPTEPADLEYIEIDSPSSTTATGPTGRTYRIPATDNEPAKIVEYPWVARFTVTLRITPDASNEDGALDFPVDVTGTSVTVQPASGGIVVPPPTGTQVYSEYELFASGNRFNAVNDTVTATFDVFYHLPQGGKECLITANFTFVDDDDNTFSDTVQVRVSP
jgi:hypothetical protein